MIRKKYLYGLIIIMLLTVLLVACKKKKNVDPFKQVNDEIVLPSSITENIDLPKESKEVPEAKIYWVSRNYKVISAEGLLIRPNEDTLVTMELFVTIGIETKTFNYDVLAKGWGSQKVDLDTFKNPSGFANLGVTNRINSENVYVVNNELEFLDAFIDSVNEKDVVIEITKDLNLGARYIGKLLKEKGLWDGVNPRTTKYLDGKGFRENTNLPQNHPILLENGVGQLMIDGRDGLMIYSKTGVTISHLTVQMKGNANNIVFRNLKLDGIWEWDEIDRGDYKALDWDFFTIEFANNIWLDHITFKTSYDGIVDVKGGVSNITLSWLNLDFTVDDFINAQFDYLEKNMEKFPFYRELRETVSRKDIATVAAGQKKGFNFGNTEGGPNFESITVTMHHIKVKNLQDRFPRLRRGDVHVYNVVLDSEELYNLRHLNMKVISQAVVPTEQGAVLMENSRLVGVNEAVKTHQASNLDSDFTGKYKITNSEYINGLFYYYGNNTDTDFLNPWKKSNQNIDYYLDFYFNNYETLPYDYELHDANKLTKIFSDNLTGAGDLGDFNWLDIVGQINPNTVDKGIKIDEDKILGLEPHIEKVNNNVVTYVPELYNLYTGKQLRLDRDFIYYVNTNLVDKDTKGIYEVIYTLVLLHNNEEVEYRQKYIVYDPNLENEVYETNIGKTFDNILSGSVDVYEAEGILYTYLSNNSTENQELVIENGIQTIINSTTIEFPSMDAKDFEYIHFVVVSNDLNSKVYTQKIDKEIMTEIRTTEEFNAMLIDPRSKGKYYIIMNDLDFTDKELYYLTADHIFQGVLDGQNYTIKNLNRHAYGGGIFHTIRDGKIKNIKFDNITVDIHRTPIYDEDSGVQTGWNSTSARSGIIAGQIKGGFGIIENIVIANSLVKTENNYGAIIIGKVEGYSDAVFRNITITNSSVDQEGEYAGGITAGVANFSTALVEDIYINGLDIFEGKDKMIGTIIGRAEVGITVRRVIVLNVTHNTLGAMGGIFGKDDRKGQNLETNFENVFSDLKPFKNEDDEIINTSQYIGNLVGNPDRSFGHVINMNNVWGTDIETGTSGLSATNTIELGDLTADWWKTNFSDLLDTGRWEIKDNLLVLKQ